MKTQIYYFIQLVTGMVISSDAEFTFNKDGYINNEKDGCSQLFWDEESKQNLVNVIFQLKHVIISWEHEYYIEDWNRKHEQPYKPE